MTSNHAARPSAGLIRAAAWCAYGSGIASAFGIAFLFAFFVLGAPTGRINAKLSLAALLIGIPGMFAVIILQILLVTDVLPFANQIVPVVVAFLVVLVWFIVNGFLGRTSEKLPGGMLLHVLAGLYIGYPIWAFSVGRRLRSY